MRVSSLDTMLGETLRPLVELGAVMRVAPFVNTLSMGLHYLLAHKDRSEAAPRVDLADWNRRTDIKEFLDGVFLFYSPSDVASGLSALSNVPGFFNSIPVTRFRQRSVFIRRNPVAERLVDLANGRLCARFFDEAAAAGFTPTVYTDIRSQARALIGLVDCRGSQERLNCSARWPVIHSEEQRELPIFVYGGPCVTYMSQESNVFVNLEVDDALVSSVPEYETHVIWYVPEGRASLNGVIRETMEAYHKCLFDAAESADASEFEAMAAACNDMLASRHPSFPAETFADPASFRQCLRDHHAVPQFSE